MNGMRVFVTGATGFVGRHVAEALRDAGHHPRCLVRAAPDADRLAADGFEVVRGDLSDTARLAEAVAGAEGVVHVAGMITARSFREMRDVNEGGTGRLATACRLVRDRPARFVVVSSLAAAGPSRPGGPGVREDEPPRPVSRYGWSKLLGERAARRALPADTSLSIVRPPAVFGPRDRGIHAFFALAARGLRARIGLRPREVSMVYGPDLAAAVRAALESPRAAGRTYHVADPAPVELRTAMLWISEAVGRRTREVLLPEAVVRAAGLVLEEGARFAGRKPGFSRDKAREFLAPGWVCDPARARDELGWAPALPMRAALAETAAWYRRERWI